MPQRKFTIVLIKPSHYDDDGYVIQWRRSTIPSNSLASVYGLLAECAEAQCSAPTSRSRSKPTTNATPSSTFKGDRRPDPRRTAAWSRSSACSRTSFPRALDIGRAVSRRGVTVVIGGFHVSRLHRHAAGIAARPQGGAGARHHPVRRRGRRPHRRVPARHRRRHAEAGLQLPQRHARHGGGGDSRCCRARS